MLIVICVPPSAHAWWLVSGKLFELGLSVELNANVGAANVVVSCLMIVVGRPGVGEWKFDVNCLVSVVCGRGCGSPV